MYKTWHGHLELFKIHMTRCQPVMIYLSVRSASQTKIQNLVSSLTLYIHLFLSRGRSCSDVSAGTYPSVSAGIVECVSPQDHLSETCLSNWGPGPTAGL